MSETKVKTYKREVASAVSTICIGYPMVIGDLGMLSVTFLPCIGLLATSFSIDAIVKQGK